eukprot:CAMPEP_0182940882 /NCGR_PEP_ID=MMETSP0105_2-20130417/48046_1 /TAXON_ID=81532 ORGANISM="Acanthoeca-like sp., Strain 10tr" /NCGR_SAMPLE_ID=MMETSP0105_2 /ASSEMBLY_ACC=CAM_ASM_000205 /LENGTH=73 /DNA_ID=CAMNT_0025080433 /DNA_START=133 /DNA_END=350 /DNA_ORIENTATION=+
MSLRASMTPTFSSPFDEPKSTRKLGHWANPDKRSGWYIATKSSGGNPTLTAAFHTCWAPLYGTAGRFLTVRTA